MSRVKSHVHHDSGTTHKLDAGSDARHVEGQGTGLTHGIAMNFCTLRKIASVVVETYHKENKRRVGCGVGVGGLRSWGQRTRAQQCKMF